MNVRISRSGCKRHRRQRCFPPFQIAPPWHRTNGALQRTSAEADRMRFDVTDIGVGIAAEELRDIFLTFHQSTRGRFAGQGTGLGLAIGERLVDLLGATCRWRASWSAAAVSGLNWSCQRWRVRRARSPRRQKTGSQVTDRQLAFAAARRRLLIADDEPTNRNVLRELHMATAGCLVARSADAGARRVRGSARTAPARGNRRTEDCRRFRECV